MEFAPTGERLAFRSDPADTTALRFDFTVAPGGGVEHNHHHLHQEEIFRCRSGALDVVVDGTTTRLTAGSEATIAPGSFHTLLNRGRVDAVCDVEYRPAGRNREWFQLLAAYIDKHGREPGLFHLSPFIGDVGIFIEGPSVRMQKLAVAMLKPLAILTGRRRRMLRIASEFYGEPFVWDR